jgi:hypothetical protein
MRDGGLAIALEPGVQSLQQAITRGRVRRPCEVRMSCGSAAQRVAKTGHKKTGRKKRPPVLPDESSFPRKNILLSETQKL